MTAAAEFPTAAHGPRSTMNYFEYFSEVEERFVQRRGTALLLSTLDWALIETWREAGVPLPAVLRGIDTAFDRYDERKARSKGRLQRVNGLAWCAQAVMEAAAELAEASVGGHSLPLGASASGNGSRIGLGAEHRPEQQTGERETGFEANRVARFLENNAAALQAAAEADALSSTARFPVFAETAARLRELAGELRTGSGAALNGLDELDRRLTVIEERLQAALTAGAPEVEILQLREETDRELAPLRTRVGAVQARQVREQLIHKRLFAAYRLPRLSLFYMPLDGDGDDTP